MRGLNATHICKRRIEPCMRIDLGVVSYIERIPA